MIDPGIERVFHEAHPPIAGQQVARPAQARDAGIRILLTQPVELAVELGDRPAEARCDLPVGGQLVRARVVEEGLAQRHEQQPLFVVERERAGGGRRLEIDALERPRNVIAGGEQRAVDELFEPQFVRPSTGFERQHARLERHRHGRARRDLGVRGPVGVGQAQRDRRSGVRQPPHAVGPGEPPDQPVEVAVLVDDEVGGPAEGEFVAGGEHPFVAGELDDEVVAAAIGDGLMSINHDGGVLRRSVGSRRWWARRGTLAPRSAVRTTPTVREFSAPHPGGSRSPCRCASRSR